MKIPFLSFTKMNADAKPDLLLALEKTLDSAWYIMGDSLKNFETEYASFSTTKHAIGVSNGLDALHLSLRGLGIGEGDEVIVPSNTYIATLLAVSMCGAKPVFVEPNEATFNIDPNKIREKITAQTRAIVPVHLYGQACEMEAIMDIASENKLVVIEDNAQAHGATFNTKITGSFGHSNATSFYPGKNLGALGDAGGITTQDDATAEKILMLRNYGSKVKYYNEIKGYNCRLDEIQAGVLSVKLKFLQGWTQERQTIARWYDEYLKDLPEITLPQTAALSSHVYHLYVIRHPSRDGLQAHLSQKGIGTLIHYPVPPHLQKAYSELGFKKGDFPIAEKMAETVLSLPIYPGLQKIEVEYICKQISEFKA